MIKIFRHLRKNFMDTGKIGKYIKYAIGEIILVVIGIIIALQINNWNSNLNDDKKTTNYLNNLIENLNDDITSFEANLSFNKTRLRGVFYILEHAELNTDRFTEIEWVDLSQNDKANQLWTGPYPDTINQKFTELSFSLLGRGFGGVSLNKSAINELYSTGFFSKIQNKDLKNKINNYYSFLAQRLEGYAIEEHEEWANETTRFFRDDYNMLTLDITDWEDPFASLKGKKDVEHYLRYLALEVNYHCIWTSEAKLKALELISLIKTYNSN